MELFKTIPGYEGLYEISTKGEVRNRHGKTLSIGVKKDCVKNGRRFLPYRFVSLRNMGQKRFFIQTLMLITFDGPKPGKEYCAMHLNDDPSDNNIGNLKWGTQKQNSQQCWERGRTNRNNDALRKVGIENGLRVPVAMEIGRKVLFLFTGVREAEKWTGIAPSSISAVCKNKRQMAGGYQWKYL